MSSLYTIAPNGDYLATPPATGQWGIYSIQRELPIVPGILGAHNYLALVNPEGQIVAELQGGPVAGGYFTVFGTEPGNYLVAAITPANGYDQTEPVTSIVPVVQGDQSSIEAAFYNAAAAVQQALDQTGMLYNGATLTGSGTENSNSVWNTAIQSILGPVESAQFNGPDPAPGSQVNLTTEPSNNSSWDPNAGLSIGGPAPVNQAAIVSPFTPDQIGLLLGSSLGSLLAQGNSLAAIPISTALGVTLGSFVTIVQNAGGGNVAGLINSAINSLPRNVLGMGAGAITSYLTAELLNAAGVKGFVAGAINTASNITIGKIASNLATNPLGNPFAGITSPANLNLAIGSFIGSQIADAILPTETQAEAIGAQLGGAVGAIGATELLGTFSVSSGEAAFLGSAGIDATGAVIEGALLDVAIPLVGAIVGYVVGDLLGELIGGHPNPWASAEIGVSPTGPDGATFTVEATQSKSGGPLATVESLAQTITQALNGILALTGGQVVAPANIIPAWIGIRDGIPAFRLASMANPQNISDVDTLVTYTVANALQQILSTGGIAGGDTYVKRAVLAYVNSVLTPGSYQVNGDLSALTGDIEIAQNYEQYVNNAALIDAVIASSPNSAFAAGWLATLAAADALGLDQRQPTDWAGGWGAFLAAQNATAEQLSVSFESNARWITVGSTTIADTIPSNAKDVITDSAANDTIGISEYGVLQANGNVLFDGVAATTAQTSQIAAVIYAGPGNSVVYAGGQGDDVIGYTGAGYGNEYLVAGSIGTGGTIEQSQNATWLFAGAGNDTLQGGASGGDMLEGGTGNDLMLGGSGSALFVGGSGDDTMVGSTGGEGDIFQVGQGDHTTLIKPGSGDDTIVFEFGDGNVTVTNAGSGDNVLSLGPGITWSNLEFIETSGGNLELELLSANGQPTGDEIGLNDWFSAQPSVQWPQFADGSKFHLPRVSANVEWRPLLLVGLAFLALGATPGCTSRTAAYLEDEQGRGVVCYGDPYWILESSASFEKMVDCIHACKDHGFDKLYHSASRAFKPVADNRRGEIPDVCRG